MKRKKQIKIGFAALCLAVWAFPASGGEAGYSGASFLKISPSPRASGMGESFASVSEDAYSPWWNPAGLGALERAEAAATHNASLEDVTHQYLSAAYPLRYGSAAALSLTRLSVSPFRGYDALGTPTGNVESSDLALGAAYGRALLKDEIERPVLSAGAGLKLISEKLAGVSANTAALDLGAIYYIRPSGYWAKKARAPELRAALVIRNIGRSAPLPLSVTAGASWQSYPKGDSRLIISLDQTISNDENYYAALGAEYEAMQLLAVRCGYRTGQDIGSGFRFGLGFRLSVVDIDYSLSPYGELGAMHKFGVSMRFGAPAARRPLDGKTKRAEKAKLIATKEKIEKLELFAKDFLELAGKDLAARRYVAADGNINKAFNLEPALKNGAWGGRQKRLAEIIGGLRLGSIQGREGVLAAASEQAGAAAQAIAEYVEGGRFKSFLLAHAALGIDMRGDPVYEELLTVLSGLVNLPVRRDEILRREALLKEKLKKAGRAFYLRQFDAAVRECEEVLVLDGENHQAWTKLGSSYYMMGDQERAKEAFKKALSIKPGDEIIRRFMREQGWAETSAEALPAPDKAVDAKPAVR